MQVDPYVVQVQNQLAATAALGDESTRAIAEALSSAAEPAVRLAVLNAVSAAANEITAALLDSPRAPAVGVHMDGDELRIEVRNGEPDEPVSEFASSGPDDSENAARISLRLPEALKSQIDSAARASGISVNAWIIHAVSRALSGSRGWKGPVGDAGTARRLTGWING
jgi:hypothetical protein